MKATRFLVAITALGGSACSLLTSLDGYTGGTADGGATTTLDASPEAAPPPPPGDAGADAPIDASSDAGLPNLHPNGDFETQTAPWYGFQADPVTLDPTARKGSRSLRVCTAAATTDYFTADDQGAVQSPVVGATYHIVAWVRTTPDKPPPVDARLFVRTVDLTPAYTVVESGQSTVKPIDGSWRMFETTLTVTKPAQRLNTFVGVDWAASSCFLLDDVRVERVN